MAAPVTVPRLGWTMEEGIFVQWLKADGDAVRPGEPLFVLEGDKAAEEVEALDEGVLRIPPDGPKPGAKVQVGQVLAYLVAEGEALAEPTRAAPAEKPPEPRVEPTPAPRTPRRRPAITPRARRVARELGLDWSALRGTGRAGRIRERDVRAAAGKGAGRLIPHTPLRKAIAARMVAEIGRA